jgi:YbbR domain-containing protein
MLKKFLHLLTHNIGLKILAFIFAVALWLLVVNVEDPEITRSFTVPLTMENETVLTDAGKMYEMVGDTDSVRVSVTAKRSIVENLTASDFTAEVDFNDLTEDQMSGQEKLQVYINMLRYGNQVSISPAKKYVTVNIEDLETKNLTLGVSLTGTAASGYAAGETTAIPTSVQISGPKSLVDQITSAVAIADISGMDSDQVLNGTIHYYNKSGEEVDTDRLTVCDDKASVQVACNIVKEISLKATASGDPSSGYEVTGVSTDPAKVKVQGPQSVLKDMSSLTISGDALDVSDRYESFSKSLSIRSYLPEDLDLADGEEDEVKVTVTIEPYQERTISFNTDDITVTGLGSGLTAEFTDSDVSLKLALESRVADSISASDITVTADLSGYEAGTSEVTLQVSLPEGASLEEKASTEVEITSSSGSD